MKEQYLKGKFAIVTGASRSNGIGAATAYCLAEHGADILLQYSSDEESVKDVCTAIKGLGVRVHAFQADASTPTFGTILVLTAMSTFGVTTIDIIVNVAGISVKQENGMRDVSSDLWDRVLHINVRGPFLLIQAARPQMTRGGRIINVSSVFGKLGSHQLPVYAASKGALNSLTVSLAEELGPKGITINAVAPGPIDLSAKEAMVSSESSSFKATEALLKSDPTAARLFSNQHMQGTKGTPKDVAETILFLASPMASYITGQHIYVDGGINVP